MGQYTLIIGNKNYSSWSLRPWIWMKQVGIEFDEKRVALFTEDMDEQLAPYFSNSKVPVLQNNDLTVWDSLAILEYLADKHPERHGWPDDRKARAVARSISAEMHSSFPDLRSQLPMNCRKHFDGFTISPEVENDIERIRGIWKYCRQEYGQSGPWLFGDFSIADAMFAPVVLRFKGYDVPLENTAHDYVETMYHNPFITEWITAGCAESEVIEMDEIEV